MNGTVEDLIEDSKSIKNFTMNGKCSNCGSCCTDYLPISEKELRKIKEYVKENGVVEHTQKNIFDTGGFDITCPFRNEIEKKCEIYPVRPGICKSFICNKNEKELFKEKALATTRNRFVNMRKEIFGNDKNDIYSALLKEYFEMMRE